MTNIGPLMRRVILYIEANKHALAQLYKYSFYIIFYGFSENEINYFNASKTFSSTVISF